MVYCTEVPDYTLATRYCTTMFMHTTVVVLQTISHCYFMVVLETVALDYTVDDAHCYIVAATHCYIAVVVYIVLLHVQHAPCKYIQSFLSSSSRFYSAFLRVQMTYKSYKMYSSVLFDISASGGNDRDHAHVFFKSHIMFLLKIKGLEYPLQYIVQIMDTHSCDDLLSYTLYTRHLLFSPFLCSNSTGMLSYSNLASNIPQLDMYSCTSFPLAVRMLTESQPNFGISTVSKDTSSVGIDN